MSSPPPPQRCTLTSKRKAKPSTRNHKATKQTTSPSTTAPPRHSGTGRTANTHDGTTLITHSIGALPILQRLLRRMRLNDFLQQHLPPEDGRTKVAAAASSRSCPPRARKTPRFERLWSNNPMRSRGASCIKSSTKKATSRTCCVFARTSISRRKVLVCCGFTAAANRRRTPRRGRLDCNGRSAI